MGRFIDFDGLVSDYEKPIYNLIYRLIGDHDEAADLTQETFVAAYRSLASFRGESTAYTWLCRIAVNRCKNRFRQRDTRRAYEGVSLDETGLLDHGATADGTAMGADPREHLERKELKHHIEQAIATLPPDYRIVAVLRDLHGLTYEEIATVAGLSVDVVRTRIARARGMLRRKLEPYLVE